MSWFLPYFAVHVPQTSVQVWHFCLNLCQPAPIIPQAACSTLMWLSDPPRPSPSWGSSVAAFIFSAYIPPAGVFVVVLSLRLSPRGEQLSWSEQRNCKKWATSALMVRHHFHMDILGQSRGWIEAGRSSGVWKAFIIKGKKQALRQYEKHKWTRMQRAEAVQECKRTC